MQTRSLKIKYTNGKETIPQVRIFGRDPVGERLFRLAERLHEEHITHAVGDGVLQVDYSEVPGGSYTLNALFEPKNVLDDGGSDGMAVDGTRIAERSETWKELPTGSQVKNTTPKELSTTSKVEDTQGALTMQHGGVILESLVRDDAVVAHADHGAQALLSGEGQSSSRDDAAVGTEPRADSPVPRQLPPDTSLLANEGTMTSEIPTSSNAVVTDVNEQDDLKSASEDFTRAQELVTSGKDLAHPNETSHETRIEQTSKAIAQPCVDLTHDGSHEIKKQNKRKQQSSDIDTDDIPVKRPMLQRQNHSVVTKGQGTEISSSTYDRKQLLSPLPARSNDIEQRTIASSETQDNSSINDETVDSCIKRPKRDVHAPNHNRDLSILRTKLGISRANFCIIKDLVIRYMFRLCIWREDPIMLGAQERREWGRKLSRMTDCVATHLQDSWSLSKADLATLHILGQKLNARAISGIETSEEENNEDDEDTNSKSCDSEWDDSRVKYNDKSSDETSSGEESEDDVWDESDEAYWEGLCAD